MNKNTLTIKKDDLIKDIADNFECNFVTKESILKVISKLDKNDSLTKENLIKAIDKINNNKTIVKDVYNMLGDRINTLLTYTDEEQDVCIKMFEGITLKGIYMPEKTKKNNLTEKVSLVSGRIKPKFNISRTYCEKLNGIK